jgi:hypothetical protein
MDIYVLRKKYHLNPSVEKFALKLETREY